MVKRVDPIHNAIVEFQKILKISECLKDKAKNKFVESFKTRSRNGPQMIVDHGLIPYLTYLASKATDERIREIARILAKVSAEIDCSDTQGIKGDKDGYAAYYIIIVSYLKKLGIVRNCSKYSIIDVIEELWNNKTLYNALRGNLITYLSEIKKLSTAYFEKEK